MFSFKSWLRQALGTQSRKAKGKQAGRDEKRAARFAVRSAPLRAEALEDRITPAIRTWSGLGADANWSTATNWVGNAAPQAEDNLVFPLMGGSSGLSATNDYGTGTRFRSVTVSDSRYDIGGSGSITLLEGLVYNATTSGAKFNVPISLGANQTFISANLGAQIQLAGIAIPGLQTLSIDGRGDLDVEGVVSGNGGITKFGDGTLILAGNNTFEGIVNVTQGAINLRNSNALGSANAGTIAGLGTVIQLQGGVTVPENIVVRDAGLGFNLLTLGAIRRIGTSTNVLSGSSHDDKYSASAFP